MKKPKAFHPRDLVRSWINEKYWVEAILGEGGMGVVYKATHRNKKELAIKLLRPELAADPQNRERFLREGYVANTVGHDGAVSILDDATTEAGLPILVMELLVGASLEAIAERLGRIGPEVAFYVAVEALDVLAAAHEKGIVHRDIKPANLFLTKQGEVKILDFGVARLREPGGASATQTGTAIGTPAFMSPEQSLGRTEEVDARSDIYAVGATLFSMLSGRNVHEGNTAQEVMVAAATKEASSISALLPSLPPALVDVVDRALEFTKERRWPTAKSMQNAIREAYVEAYGAPLDRGPARDLLLAYRNAEPLSRRSFEAAETLQEGYPPIPPAEASERGPDSAGVTGAPSTTTNQTRKQGSRMQIAVVSAALGVGAAGLLIAFWVTRQAPPATPGQSPSRDLVPVATGSTEPTWSSTPSIRVTTPSATPSASPSLGGARPQLDAGRVPTRSPVGPSTQQNPTKAGGPTVLAPSPPTATATQPKPPPTGTRDPAVSQP